MPISQLNTDGPDGYVEVDKDLLGREVDKLTLLVKCWGDENLDASPMALVEIDRASARGLLAKLDKATGLAREYHGAGDVSLDSIQFMSYLPDFFDAGIFFDGEEELELLGDLADREGVVLLGEKQARDINSLLDADNNYRNLRKDICRLVVDPPIDGEPRPHSKGQVYWRAVVKHTDFHVETRCLDKDLLEEIADRGSKTDFEKELEALVDDE